MAVCVSYHLFVGSGVLWGLLGASGEVSVGWFPIGSRVSHQQEHRTPSLIVFCQAPYVFSLIAENPCAIRASTLFGKG